MRGPIKGALLLVTSVLYWQIVRMLTGATEPWDADTYWIVWYPVSLALSTIGGFFLRRNGWLGGAIVTVAQVPFLWIEGGEPDALWAAGVAVLGLLAIPAIVVSALAGRWARRGG